MSAGEDLLRVGGPLPAAIGRCADLYHDVRELRLSMEKEAAQVLAREREIREHIINSLSKGDDTGAAGMRYRAQIVTNRKFTISDWGIFTSWIRKHDRFDLVQKRLADVAVKDTYEQEARVLPGLATLLVPDVSITKI